MKNIVIFDEYNEVDLKPTELLDEYIQLTKDDVAKLLIECSDFVEVDCPGCKGSKILSSFVKFGVNYNECAQCNTLYVSPRPSEKVLTDYYTNAKSRIFWREKLSQATNKKRKEKIIKPRFDWILESTQEYLPNAEHFVDLNTSQYGYIEELIKTGTFKKKTLVDPFFSSKEISEDSSVDVVNSSWEDISFNDDIDVISAFEVINRVSNVEALFSKINSALRPGGLCFITTILVSGFDLQILWDKSNNIMPPDRLNVFSVEGLKLLFEDNGFDCLEFSTPGILDVEIVAKAKEEDPSLEIPRFFRNIIEKGDENIKRALQEFLQENLLSSYCRILLRKKEK